MALTSIIIPTHNRPHLLRRAVDSAWGAGANVEVIVVDDASLDETAAVCASLSGINYIRLERNHGVAGARNIGLRSSKGEYVTFLDDDDVRLPNSIDEQVKLLEADNAAGLIYGQAILGDQSGSATNEMYPLSCKQGDIFWSLMSRNFIPCGTAVFRRSCINTVGSLDDSVPGLDDWDYWVRIAEVHTIIALEKPVMIWRRSTPDSDQGSSLAATIASKAIRQFRGSWMKLSRARRASHELRTKTWRAFCTPLAAHLLYDANNALRARKVTRALNDGFALVRLSPSVVLQFARKSNRLRLVETITGPIDEASAYY